MLNYEGTRMVPQVAHNIFYLTGMFFKEAKKVKTYLGNLSEMICRQKLSKIAHSGHTG